MIARFALWLIALMCLVIVGCGGSSSSATADSLAATKLEGQTVKQTITEDAKATDFLSPDAVKLGVIDAAHVIGEPTFTVYQYADTAAAEAAMNAWRADTEDGMMGEFPVSQPVVVKGDASDLSDVADESLVLDLTTVEHVIARKGAFVVRTIGSQAAGIETAKSLFGGL
ncbi:MAG: hypothetical protein DYG90_04640 [Chloroflexi bacterium CFX6]|nr:hypothetical protein [Chloroflexi bacterium CFX6]